MTKAKAPKAKKLKYELIDPSSEIGEPMYDLLQRLVAEHHDHLHEARIALAWTTWQSDVDGRWILGKCRKVSQLDRELMSFDFVILLNREFWENPTVKPEQRAALVDHELCHAAVKEDAEGEPVTDARGRTIYRIRKHTIEEFHEIVERHGCYKADIETFYAALRRSQQPALDLEADQPSSDKHDRIH